MKETIVAQATAPGRGGIGILRVSGPKAVEVAQAVLGKCPKPRMADYLPFKDADGTVLDQGIALYFKSPNSFTGEDVLELQGHGGQVVLDLLLKRILQLDGVRLARPGEFSEQAFLNDKLDLAQAEAIADLIDATSEQAARSALKSLQGEFSNKVNQLVDSVIYLRTYVEASIDFPDEEIDFLADGKIEAKLREIINQLDLVRSEAKQGSILREGMKVVIAGRPNAGKSSLLNALAGREAAIVTDIAGTTRDAIDTEIVYNGTEYVFIDTAGLRRKSKIKENIERYSIIRTVAAIERSDVVILMIDATEGVSEQDAKIAGIAHDRGRGLIIAVNKWDAIEKDNHTVKEYTKKVRDILSFVPYAEIIFISALTGQRTKKIFDLLETVIENHAMRIQTGVLNEILMEAVALQQPPSDKGKRLKLFYMTQVSTKPPTFVLFVNKKELMHFSYQRYIENRIRDTFGFMGTPIRIFIRERKEKE